MDSAARLCAMNLYLHGIGGDETNIAVDDSLRAHRGVNYDLVLTNPLLRWSVQGHGNLLEERTSNLALGQELATPGLHYPC